MWVASCLQKVILASDDICLCFLCVKSLRLSLLKDKIYFGKSPFNYGQYVLDKVSHKLQGKIME